MSADLCDNAQLYLIERNIFFNIQLVYFMKLGFTFHPQCSSNGLQNPTYEKMAFDNVDVIVILILHYGCKYIKIGVI